MSKVHDNFLGFFHIEDEVIFLSVGDDVVHLFPVHRLVPSLNKAQDGRVVGILYYDVTLLGGDTVVCVQGVKFWTEAAALGCSCANCELG